MSYWINLFVSFKGRITRRDWWTGYLILFAISMTFTGIEMWIYADADPFDKVIIRERTYHFLFFNLLALWPSLALYNKRLHDLNRSSWGLLVFFVPNFLYLGLALVNPVDLSFGTTLSSQLSYQLMTFVHILSLVLLGGLQGTKGDNAYGPDPSHAAQYKKPRPSLLSTLFSLQGRLARASFWRGLGIALIIFAGLFLLYTSVFSFLFYLQGIPMSELAREGVLEQQMQGTIGLSVWTFLAISFPLFFYHLFALSFKRLHDRGRSGLWLFLPLLLSGLAFAAYTNAASAPRPILEPLPLSMLGLLLLAELWLLIEILILRGKAEDNKYGPDPLAPLTPPGGETN